MEQCQEYGYYEVTQGYRKIPGDICSGGINLAPTRYQCTMGGKLLSFRGFMWLAVLSALLYFGWPMIETLIVLSPIPDPKDLKRSAKNVLTTIKGKFTGASEEVRSADVNYQSGFEKGPDSLADDDEDEEDVGRDFSQTKDLNYDSDEKDEFGSSE